MSMLDRYRKTGGFVQLLKLLETCGHAKQEKFLEIIRSEDALWADAIELKMLSFERIFEWNDDAVAEIVGTLQDLTVAIILHGVDPGVAERVRATFTHARRRRVDDLFSTNTPAPSDVAAMQMKVVETVRQMAIDGYLRFDKVDAALAIEDGVEERLAHGAPHPHEARPGGAKPKAEAAPDETTSGGTVLDFSAAAAIGANERAAAAGESPATIAELSQLRKRVLDLGKENATLRHEVSSLRGKMEQIKKIV